MRPFLLLSLLAAGCTTPEGRAGGDCSDGGDNDGDGLFDCADDGCTGSPDCAETDTDTDTDSDTDTDTDADSDTDTDTDTDTDSDTDTDTDTDSDTDTDVPCGADCRWTGEVEIPTADYVLSGEHTDDRVGLFVLAGADVTGDGADDIVATAPYASPNGNHSGRVYVVSGPVTASGSVGDAGWILDGTQADANLGWGPAFAGDIDGDGVEDLLVNAPDSSGDGEGAVYFVPGGQTGQDDVSTFAAAVWHGSGSQRNIGNVVAGLGDVTGDGLADFGFTDPSDSSLANTAGGIYIYSDPVDPSGDTSDANARLFGTTSNAFGSKLAGPTDFDGDGVDDILSFATGYATSGGSRGAIEVVLGPISGSTQVTTPDVAWEVEPGTSLSDEVHLGSPGDTSGDGLDDGLLCLGYGVSNVSVCYVVNGGSTGTHSLFLADARIAADTTNDRQRLSFVGRVGDLDADGYAEIAFGDPAASDHGSSSGAVYLYYGPQSGSPGLGDADARFIGTEYTFMGAYGKAGGELTGDADRDLVLSGCGYNGDASMSGGIFVFAGG